MTCDDYQIAFDQLEAGAPAARTRAEVDAHVATCTACTAYVALSRKLSTSMTTTFAAVPSPLDPGAMRDRMLHEMRFERYQAPLVSGLMTVGLLAGVLMSHASGSTRAIAIAVVLAIGAASYFAIKALRARRFGKYHSDLLALESADGSELLAGVRAKLDLRIQQGRKVIAIAGAGAALQLVTWLTDSPERQVGRLGVIRLVGVGLMVAGMIKMWLDIRRYRRERAQLGD